MSLDIAVDFSRLPGSSLKNNAKSLRKWTLIKVRKSNMVIRDFAAWAPEEGTPESEVCLQNWRREFCDTMQG